MDSEERGALSDNQMLFTLLATLIKRAGGEIRISEAEMDAVSTKDMVAMYYDQSAKQIVLTTHLRETPGTEEDIEN